jgi:uncharacterized membrane protein YqjE
MAKPTTPQSLDKDGEQSVGDLVAQAVKDVTQLARYELDLAKLELRADAGRLILAGVLLIIAAPAVALILVMLSFAMAYGIVKGLGGGLTWLAFVCVAMWWVIVAIVLSLIARKVVRGFSGLSETRKTVRKDLSMLKRDEEHPATQAVEAG